MNDPSEDPFIFPGEAPDPPEVPFNFQEEAPEENRLIRNERPVTNVRPLPPLPINYVPLRTMDIIGNNTFAQNRNSYKALGRVKPLRPNLLDEKDKEIDNKRAAQRRKAGTKWVAVR